MSNPPAEKPWRPRFRLSVRTLLALVLVCGGGIGWIVHRARVQREAVAMIKQAGGEVAYRWQWTDGTPVPGSPKPPWPAWVRRVLGPEYLDTVSLVRLQGPQFGDEELRAACRLPALEELIVVDTSITDAGAEDLRQLTSLRSLDLRLNRITGRPLRHIAGMSELRELKLAMRLSPVPLRDEDMAFFKRLTKLERLMLPSTDLTDAWLVYIADLRGLKVLELYDMSVTTDGLERLAGLTNLNVLSLHGTKVTSVEPLRPLTRLRVLCLAYTPADDATLERLPGWPQLLELDLRRTKVTDGGVADLKAVRPQLKVTR